MNKQTVQSAQSLLPFAEIIKLARKQGVKFGKGDPVNRLRYYTKTGLLPHASRKSFNGAPAVGCYPLWVVDTLTDIDNKIKSGLSIQEIIRQKNHNPQIPLYQPPTPSQKPQADQFDQVPQASPVPQLNVTEEKFEESHIEQVEGPEIKDQQFPFKDQLQIPFKAVFKPLAYTATFILVIGLIITAIYVAPITDQRYQNVKDYITSAVKPLSQFASIPQFKSPGSEDETLRPPIAKVLGALTEPYLLINVETETNQLLNALGGIRTNGADANLGTGKLTASNVIYDIIAGQNISVSDNQTPTISLVGTLANFPSSFNTNGVLFAQDTTTVTSTSAGTSGQFVIANSSQVPAFVTLSGDATLSSSGGITISADAVALSTDTSGDYVKNLTAGNGITLSGNSGEGSTPTVTVDATTTSTTSTTSSNSGLEVSSDGLRILGGCTAGSTNILKWNGSTWACAADAGGSTAGIINVEEGDTPVGTSVDTIDYLAGDFVLTASPANEVNITLETTLTTPVGNVGDWNVGGGDLTTSQTTSTLFDTTATTLSLGGAATTALNIGNGSGNYTAINVGSGSGTHTINIAGTGATGADTINIGTGGTAADTITIGNTASSTSLTLNSGTGVINIGTSIAKTITLGNSTGATALNFDTGTGGINLGDNANAKTVDIGGNDASGTDTVRIATEGTAADNISIGNTNASTTLSLRGGAGNVSIGETLTLSASSAQTTAIDITDTDYTNALSIADNNITGTSYSLIGTTSTIDFTNFDVATTGNITVASGVGLDTNAAGILAIGNTTATTVNIGNTSATTLALGAGGALARTVNIGTGTGIDTINIGTGGTGVDVIRIGDSVADLALTDANWSITTAGAATFTTATLTTASPTTTAITVTDTDYTNALDVGDNNITGAGYQVTSTSGGLTVNSTSANLALTTTTSGNITATPALATGLFNVLTGNLKIGDGTPGVSLDGEDVYIEGTLEVDASVRLDTLSGTGTESICRNTTTNVLGTCTAGGTFPTLDNVYDNSATNLDTILNIDQSSINEGLIFSLDDLAEDPTFAINLACVTCSSFEADDGDLVIQDEGTTFAAFRDDGSITLGKSAVASTINVGNGTAIDTINIGTGGTGVDVIRIGDSVADLALTDANWSITTAGVATFTQANVDNLRLDGNTFSSTSGDITIDSAGTDVFFTDGDIFIIGGHAGGVAYNVISDAGGAPGEASINSDDDLYIEGSLEVDGVLNLASDASLSVGGTTDPYVNETGDTMTGTLTFSGVSTDITTTATEALTLESGTTGTITIGGDTSAETIQLGTGGAAKTVQVGSTNSTSSLTLQSGTGDIAINSQDDISTTFVADGQWTFDAATTDSTVSGLTTGVFQINIDANPANSATAQGIYLNYETIDDANADQTFRAVKIDFLNSSEDDADTTYALSINNVNNAAAGADPTDALFTLENSDPTAGSVTTGIHFLGGSFTTGIDFDAADFTTEIVLENAESISNQTDNQINLNLGSSGTLLLTSSTSSTISNSAGALAINAFATALNLQADGAVDVNIAGGSGTTGCTVANSTGNFTCSGDATFSGGDVTGANSDSIDIAEAADATFTLTRNDAGTVTLTSADNDANADLTVVAGGTGILTLGDSGSVTTITGSDTNIAIIDGSTVNLDGDGSPTADLVQIGSGDTSTTSGVDGLQLTFGTSNVSGNVIDITPSYAGGATDTLTYSIIDIDAFSPTNAAGTDTVNGLAIGNLTDPGATITSTAISIGSGWDNEIYFEKGSNDLQFRVTAPTGATRTVTIPSLSADADFCFTTGNCVGSGGGVSTSGGTTNTLAKFTGSQTIGDASITDDGTTVTFSTDNTFTLAGSENIALTNSTASTDQLALTVSGVTTDGVDGASIAFTQADDADATDNNSALRIALTSSSGDADLLYGIDIANITAGTATETAIRIGEDYDNLFEIEGSTDDTVELFLRASDPTTSDKVITFPDDTGTVCLSSGNCAGGAGGSKWTDGGVTTYFTAYLTDDLVVGSTGPTAAGEYISFQGVEDEIQFLVQGNATQTSNLILVEQDGGTDVLTLTNAGNLTILADLTVSGGDITGTGDESIDIGEASANTITFLIDATEEARLSSSALFPVTAEGNALGTSSAEWDQLFLGDNAGVNFGLDDDFTLLYDETTDDRLELTSATAGAGVSVDFVTTDTTINTSATAGVVQLLIDNALADTASGVNQGFYLDYQVTNTADVNAMTHRAFRLDYTNTEADATDTTYAFSLNNANDAAGAAVDALFTLENNDANTAVADGITFLAGGANSPDFTDAIDISAAAVTNAINIGANTILATGTAYSLFATGGTLTLDASTDINLDADGADVILLDGGTEFARFTNTSTDLTIDAVGANVIIANGDTLDVYGAILGLDTDANVNDQIRTSSGSIATALLYWGNDLLCDPTLTNCGWATSSSSPFTSLAGVITKTTTTDVLQITEAQAGDYGLLVDASVAPTVDLVQITNTGFGTVTNNVDSLVSAIFTASDAGADNNSAIHAIIGNTAQDASDVINGLEVTGIAQTVASSTQNLIFIDPAASGNTLGTLNGINIDSITTPGAATENAITIGSGWDTDINATTSLEIGIGGTNQLTLTDGALAGTTDNDIDLGTSSSQFKDFYIEGNIIADTTTDIDIDDNLASALTISQGTNEYLNISTTDTTTSFSLDLPVAGSSSTTANLFTSTVAKTINIGTGDSASGSVFNFGSTLDNNNFIFNTGQQGGISVDLNSPSLASGGTALNIDTGSVLSAGGQVSNGVDINYDNGSAAGTVRALNIDYSHNASTTTEEIFKINIAEIDAGGLDFAIFAGLVIDNADTTLGDDLVLTDALRISNTGGKAGGITNAINITGSGITTDLSLQNGETIDNDTNGRITIGGGDLAISSTFDLIFGNGEAINNDTDESITIDEATTDNTLNSTTRGVFSLLVDASISAASATNYGLYIDYEALDDADGSDTFAAARIDILNSSGDIPSDSFYGLSINNVASANAIAPLALLHLNNSDTGAPFLQNAIQITSSGGGTINDAIDIGTTAVTTDLRLQNGETIDNDTDGRITIGGADLLLSSTTGDLIFGFSESFDNDTDGRIDMNGGDFGITSTTGDLIFGNTETLNNDTNGLIVLIGAGGADNTDLEIDLDGTRPELRSITDTTIGINDNLDVEGTIQIELTATASDEAVCKDGAEDALGDVNLTDCTTGVTADYAEIYAFQEQVEYGQIVAIGDETTQTLPTESQPEAYTISKLKKAVIGSNKIIGIVSNNYSDFTSTGKRQVKPEDYPMPVALNGRVPTFVSTENGSISIGDPITSSSIPGVGMKAIQPGRVVGIALASYVNLDPTAVGTIIVFVNPTYYIGDLAILETANSLQLATDILQPQTATGSASLGESQAISQQPLATSSATLLDDTNILIEALGRIGITVRDAVVYLAEAVIDKLTVKELAINNDPATATGSANNQEATIGEAKIIAGETKVKIDNLKVKDNSKIFITFRGKAQDIGYSISEIIPDQSFTVEISRPLPEDVIFDFWIVATTAPVQFLPQSTQGSQPPATSSPESPTPSPAPEPAPTPPESTESATTGN